MHYSKTPTVLSLEPCKPQDQLLFLGVPPGLQRYDNPKHPIFLELTDKQFDFIWRHNDVNISKDRGDHARLTDAERDIFDNNLRFQIAGDSMLSRSINVLSTHCTNSTLEICMQWWSAFETIHSRSYTHLLSNAYPNPGSFFDSVLETPAIVSRVNALKSRFDALLSLDNTDIRQNIFNAVLAAQIMEGVTFYVSFACSFYFAQQGKMTGNGAIIKLISRDENLHVAITQHILKIWRDRPEEGFQDIYNNAVKQGLIAEAYKAAVEMEKEWAEYLFHAGSLVGLTPRGLGAYSEHIANNRLANLRHPTVFGAIDNPFKGWITPYFDSRAVQTALQEEDNTTYARQTGGGITAGGLSGFSLDDE